MSASVTFIGHIYNIINIYFFGYFLYIPLLKVLNEKIEEESLTYFMIYNTFLFIQGKAQFDNLVENVSRRVP